MFVLPYSSVCIILLTSSVEIDDLVSERIKGLRVNNQSFVESVPEESLSSIFFILNLNETLTQTDGDYFSEQTWNKY